MTPDYMAHVLQAGGMIEDWIVQVRKRALELVRNGTNIPGFKVVEAMARRSFDLPEDCSEKDIIAAAGRLAEITKIHLPERFYKMVLVGITEAEKIIKEDARFYAPKGKSKQAVEAAMEKFAFLTTKKSSGTLSLVGEDDPRPAVNRNAFDGVAQIPHIRDGE